MNSSIRGHKSRLKPGQVLVTLSLVQLGSRGRRVETRSENLVAVVDAAQADELRRVLAAGEQWPSANQPLPRDFSPTQGLDD